LGGQGLYDVDPHDATDAAVREDVARSLLAEHKAEGESYMAQVQSVNKRIQDAMSLTSPNTYPLPPGQSLAPVPPAQDLAYQNTHVAPPNPAGTQSALSVFNAVESALMAATPAALLNNTNADEEDANSALADSSLTRSLKVSLSPTLKRPTLKPDPDPNPKEALPSPRLATTGCRRCRLWRCRRRRRRARRRWHCTAARPHPW